ncbi:MAG: ATP-binding cassette domain-containing protein [Flavobacteriales bacterium]
MEAAKIENESISIHLKDVGKRFNYTWIFRNIDLELISGEKIALLGANGSGKSTLMQCIAGYQTISEGKLTIRKNQNVIDPATFYNEISIAAPYQELIDDFTFLEMLDFHFKLKIIRNGYSVSDLINLSELEHVKGKKLLYFSSGMRQRVKLIMAVMSDTHFLFLDEPCANLDTKGVNWYRNLIEQHTPGRAVIVCSNHQSFEYDFCQEVFELNHQTLHKI